MASSSARIADVRLTLDHKFLNKIEALGTPTLENLSRFDLGAACRIVGGLTRVSVHRDSCNESCTITDRKLKSQG